LVNIFFFAFSIADDVGVLFENDRRQRERLYKSLKLIVMKPFASKFNFLCQKCAKTHLRAFVTSNNFPGAKPPDPQPSTEGKEGKGRGGKERGRKEEKRGEGRGGEGREGREGEREIEGSEGRESGEREKSTPHQQILEPPLPNISKEINVIGLRLVRLYTKTFTMHNAHQLLQS
jgi:hypothetical protein